MSDLSKKLREALIDVGVYDQDPVIEQFNRVWEEALILEASTQEKNKKAFIDRLKAYRNQFLQSEQIGSVKKYLQAVAAEARGRRLKTKGKAFGKDHGSNPPIARLLAAKEMADIIKVAATGEYDNNYHEKIAQALQNPTHNLEIRSVILGNDDGKWLEDVAEKIRAESGGAADKISAELKNALNTYREGGDEEKISKPSLSDAQREREQTSGAKIARINAKHAKQDQGDQEDIDAADLGVDEPTTRDEPKTQAQTQDEPATGTSDDEAYDVQVIQTMGDKVMARVKGLAKDSKGQNRAVWRHVTLSADELKRVTGSPKLGAGNIHDYIHDKYKAYRDMRQALEKKLRETQDPKVKEQLVDLKARYLNRYESSLNAYSRLRQGQEKPTKFIDYLKQQAGSNTKEGLLNALHRMASTGKVNRSTLPLAMAMNEHQINQLIEDAHGGKKLSKASVLKFMDQMRREFGPTSESKEYEAPINENLRDTIGRMSRALKRPIEASDIQFARRLMLYRSAAELLNSNPGPYVEMMKQAGNFNLVPQKFKSPAMMPGEEQPEKQSEPEVKKHEGKPAVDPNKYAQIYNQFEPVLANPKYLSILHKLILQEQQKGNKVSQPALELLHFLTKKDFKAIADLMSKTPDMLTHYRQLAGFIAPVLSFVQGGKNPLGGDDEQPKKYSNLKPKGLTQKGIRRAGAKLFGRMQKKESFIRKYSQTVLESPEIAEARIDAHDLASAGIDLYTQRCNQLGRSKIDRMYDQELDLAFNELMESARKRFEDYQEFLEFKLDYADSDPFNSLVAISILTEDPITHFDTIREYVNNPMVVIESYRNSLVVPPKKAEYKPISNII